MLHGTDPSLPFELQLAGKTITVLPPPGVAVGVERLNRRAPGEPRARAPILPVLVAEGPVTIKADSQEETLDGPGGIVMEADGSFSDKNDKGSPTWVTETEPSPFDQKVGEQFLKFFRPDRPIVSSLVEASEDEQKDVCRLAISALRAVGDISFIVPLLNKQGDFERVHRPPKTAIADPASLPRPGARRRRRSFASSFRATLAKSRPRRPRSSSSATLPRRPRTRRLTTASSSSSALPTPPRSASANWLSTTS